MRKIIAAVLLLTLCFSCAYADTELKAPDYLMEGYDGDGANHDWDTNLFFRRMQERTGISFQFRQNTDFTAWTQRIQEMTEGEDLPDVLFKAGLTVRQTEKMYKAGQIIDLKPYLAEYAPNLNALLCEHEDWAKAITLEDGSIPALPNFNQLQNNDALWLNTSWIKTLKLEIPNNADELTDVLRAFKTQDPNRNGKADEVPLTFLGMWDLRFLGHAFGIIDNDYYISVRNGKVSSALTTDENRAFLSWLRTLWDEKLLDHRGFSMIDSLRQVTDDNAVPVYGAVLSVTPLTVVSSSALNQYSVPAPLEYNGKRIYRDLLGDVIRGTFAITKNCSDPEKLVAWVDFLYSEEGSRMAQSGLENEEYIWNEDGLWEWTSDLATVASMVLPEATISEGGSAPGITSAEFQLKYADTDTREAVTQLYGLKQYSVQPYPCVILTEADEKRIAELQSAIAPYAENTMAAFVTGDLELNDKTWAEFCSKIRQLGLEEEIAIWQKYIQ